MAQPSSVVPLYRGSKTTVPIRSPTKEPENLPEMNTLPPRNSRDRTSQFDSLLNLSSKGAVEAFIPECMVKSNQPNFPYVYYTESDSIKRVSGLQAFNKFFELVDLRLSALPQREKERYPRYLLQSKLGSFRTCMTMDDCVTRWTELGPDQYLIRRYVRSKGENPKIYRVVYRQGAVQGFKIRNKERTRGDGREKSWKRKLTVATKSQSIYQHSPSEFQYAGKLHRDSFSPYMPFASKLSPKTQSPIASPILQASMLQMSAESTGLVDGERDPAEYVVNVFNLDSCKVTPMDHVNPTLESQVRKLVTSIQRMPKQLSIEEMTLDFVKTCNATFILVDCEMFSESGLSPRRAGVDTVRLLFQQLSGYGDLPRAPSHTSLTFPLLSPAALHRNLSEQMKDPEVERFPRFSDIPQSSASKDIGQAAVSHLSIVEEKYDDLRGKAKKAREVTQNLVSVIEGVQGNKGREFVQRVVCRAAEDEVLRGAFRRKSEEMMTIEVSLLRALQGDVSLPYSSQLKQLQTQMSLSSPMISAFRSLACEETASLGLPSERQDQVLTRLESFLKDFHT